VAAVVIVIMIIAIVAVAVTLVVRSRPSKDDGMTSFRRHIDALSPEARREVHDRVRRHEEDKG
jgi:hypothetical protein